jgi:hypothetical protein
MAREIGADDAEWILNNHESLLSASPAETRMDTFNNSVGLGIGVSALSDEQVATGCMSALNAGELVTSPW